MKITTAIQKEDVTPEVLAHYVEALKSYLQDQPNMPIELINLIQNLPSPKKIKIDFGNIETQLLQESVGYAWRKITGKELIEQLSTSNSLEKLHGNYWMVTGGVLFKGDNHTTVIKRNIHMFASLLDIDPFVIHEGLSKSPNDLIDCVLRNGGMRVYVDSNGIAYFQMSSDTYGKWGRKKIKALDLKTKNVKILDVSRPYNGWDSGILIRL